MSEVPSTTSALNTRTAHRLSLACSAGIILAWRATAQRRSISMFDPIDTLRHREDNNSAVNCSMYPRICAAAKKSDLPTPLGTRVRKGGTMRKLVITLSGLVFCAALLGDDASDRAKLIGTWQLQSGSDKDGSLWTLESKGDGSYGAFTE